MARKYFGTDGMRGEANKDLTIDLVGNLGLALGYYLKKHRKKVGKPRIILGTDTRISGYMIRSALSAGLNSMGVHIDFVGVLPTPGVCYLTRKLKADAGIMISASHNPVKDNGIKIFSSNGYKLPDKVEEEIEALMEDREKLLKHQIAGDDLGRFKYVEDDMRIYLDFLASTVKTSFKGLKIVIDAANGAAYRVASKIYQKLGADIIVINNIPNGKNINVNCGSTHPELLQEVVKVYKADLGLAFDGDADRLIVVDEQGRIIDGDRVLCICGKYLKAKGLLATDKITATVMSNIGLHKHLKEYGIGVDVTKVGDRYVLESMRETGSVLGGEQSGHMIFLNYTTTGDGVLSSLQFMKAYLDSGKKLSELRDEIQIYPQALVNARVDNAFKATALEDGEVKKFIADIEAKMEGTGRVLIRPSGTEPLIRVMLEGEDIDEIQEYAEQVATLISDKFGR